MKNNGLKVTTATVLLLAGILGTPLIGDAHGNDHSKNRGQSHRMMDKNHHKQEKSDYNNIKWEKSKKKDNRANGKSENRFNKDKKSVNVQDINNVEKQNSQVKQQKKSDNKPKASTVTYAEADAYGKDTILPLIEGIEAAKADLDWDNLLANYYSLNKAIKGTSIFNKVEGENHKATLAATYNAPAKEEIAELRLPLTIYAGIKHAEAKLDNGETNRAVAKLHMLKELVNKIENVEGNVLLQDLEAKIKALETKVNNVSVQDFVKVPI